MDISGRSGTTNEPEWIKTARSESAKPLDNDRVTEWGTTVCNSKSATPLCSRETAKRKGLVVNSVHCVSVRLGERESSAGMASSPCGNSNFDSGLEIKTRSVEQTLIPLVSQVSTSFRHNTTLHWYFWPNYTFKTPSSLSPAAFSGRRRLTFSVYLGACFRCVLCSKSVSRAENLPELVPYMSLITT